MGIVRMIYANLGYCGQCGLPKVVGYLRLQGWYHTFALCNLCLSQIGSEIDKQYSERNYKEEMGK